MHRVASRSRIRPAIRRLVDSMLVPWNLAIGDKRSVEVGRRTTHRAALEHAKRTGFEPRTVIDVGVADGTPELYAAFPDSRIVLVEPMAEAEGHLRAIASRYPRVEYVLAAAAARTGRVKLHVPHDIARASRYWESDFVPATVTEREVPAITIDQLRREKGLQGPMLLKVDVQGAELDVLEGARETLEDAEYVILESSFFQFFPEGPLVGDLVEYMGRRGFALYDLMGIQHRPLDGAISMVDAAFVKASGRFRQTHRFQTSPLP
jgi:FkbM family methyltransferase